MKFKFTPPTFNRSSSRRSGKRGLGRRNLVAPLALMIFVGLVYLFAWSPIFTAKSLHIIGAPNSAAQLLIEKESEVTLGQQLARVEPRSISNRLGAIDWVRSSKISRNWFNGKVTISLKTRIPVAIYNGRVIDSTGSLFDLAGSQPSGLPVVSGPSTSAGLEAIKLFSSLPNEFRARVTSLAALTDTTFALMVTNNSLPIRVIWGANDGAADISLKIEVFKALTSLKENQKIKRIDLSAPHAPIVK